MSTNTLVNTIIGTLVALLILLTIWVNVAAPCWIFKWYPVREIPGRCVEILK